MSKYLFSFFFGPHVDQHKHVNKQKHSFNIFFLFGPCARSITNINWATLVRDVGFVWPDINAR